MKITKMLCAEHLLDVAADVYCRLGSCPAVMHLAGAAAEIAINVATRRKPYPPGEAPGYWHALVRADPEVMKDVRTMRNWIKHADTDPDDVLDWFQKRPSGGNAARAAELLLHTAALEIANVFGRTTGATDKVARILRHRAPELSRTLSEFEDHLQ